MRLSGCDMDSDYEPVAVANQMDLCAKATSRTPQRMVKWLSHLRPFWSAQLPRVAPFFFRPSRRSAGPDDGGVDTPQVMVDLALVIQVVQQRGDDADPGAVLTPTVEARENRLPGAVAFRKITHGAPVCRIQRMPLRIGRGSLKGWPACS